jgi:hypothetical protein
MEKSLRDGFRTWTDDDEEAEEADDDDDDDVEDDSPLDVGMFGMDAEVNGLRLIGAEPPRTAARSAVKL